MMGVITFIKQLPLLDPLLSKPKGGRYLLHLEATDEEIASALWAGAKATAVDMDGRWLLPGRLEITLSTGLYGRFSEAGRLNDLRDFLRRRLEECAFAEYYEFRMEAGQSGAQLEIKCSEAPDTERRAFLIVTPVWPVPEPQQSERRPAASDSVKREEADRERSAVLTHAEEATVPCELDSPPSWCANLPAVPMAAADWGRFLFSPHSTRWEECLDMTLSAGRACWLPPPNEELFLHEEEVAQKLILSGLLHDRAVIEAWATILRGRLHPQSGLLTLFRSMYDLVGVRGPEVLQKLVASGTQISLGGALPQRTPVCPLFRLDIEDQIGHPPRVVYVALGMEAVRFSASGALAFAEAEACRLSLPKDGGSHPTWNPPLPSASRRWTISRIKPSWRPGLNPTRKELLIESFCPTGHGSWLLTAEGAEILATREDTLLVGRDPGANDLALPLDGLVTGAAHFAFLCDATGVISLVDLGSTNGTEINGRRLASFESLSLFQGDLIRVGATPMRVVA